MARRRYLAVDPDNRLVAANLEADWNEALGGLTAAQEDYERQHAHAVALTDADRARVAALAADFPALWSDPRTPHRERKRMARLLIEDVTLRRDDRKINVGVRLRSGQTTMLHVPVGLSAAELRRTPADVIAAVDRLLDDHTESEIADILNSRGLQPVVSSVRGSPPGWSGGYARRTASKAASTDCGDKDYSRSRRWPRRSASIPQP